MFAYAFARWLDRFGDDHPSLHAWLAVGLGVTVCVSLMLALQAVAWDRGWPIPVQLAVGVLPGAGVTWLIARGLAD